MEVHAAAGLAVERLRHEGRGLTVADRDVLHDVLDDLRRVAGAEDPHERRLDLALPRPADLVMVVLHVDAGASSSRHISRAEVVERVLRRDRVVAAVERDQMAVSRRGAVPVGLRAVDAVRGDVDAVLDRDVVEDVELVLGSPDALVRDARRPQILLGAPDDVARVEGERRFRVGLVRRADEAEGRLLAERVAERRRRGRGAAPCRPT